ncbi:DUF2157 domain-containing protein [Aeromicrobium sp. Leaf350]|uniref:DUF2157 domain-containing protein n=1 Tax=Aeromicrobium sp. Leaf350 TaxID=2876565 RepID=UPI001E5EDB14|nr:DUF2157 domain-containing protein [Aeromicrobium sp. Leaf350]
MKYADAARCPDCRALLEGRRACAVCGFDTESPEVTQIWSHLEQIDELVAQARAREVATPEPAPASATVPPPVPPPVTTPPVTTPPVATLPPPFPGAPATPAAAPGAGLSAGSVILGLGATLLVVAAIIFVSFAWSVLGIGGRAAILALLTVAVAGAGGWALARRLRGSTEALWLVFAGFLSADWFAACGLGLFGLDGLDGWQVAVPWWVLLCLASAAVGTASRRVADHPVLTLEVAAGLSLVPVTATIGAALADQDVRLFWLMGMLTLLGAAVAVAALLLRQMVWAGISGAVAAVCGVVMAVAAVTEAAANRDLDAYVGQVHGLPLLLVTLVVSGLAAWRPAREAAVAVGVLLLALLVALPLVDPLDGQAWLLWVAGLAVLVAVLRLPTAVGPSAVGLGLAVATGVLGVVVLMAWFVGLAPIGTVLDAAAQGPRDLSLFHGVPRPSRLSTLDWWATVVTGSGLVGVLLAAGRGHGVPESLRRCADVVAGLVLAVTVAAVLADQGVPVVLLATLTLVVGLVLVVVARWVGVAWEALGLAVVLLSPLVAAATWNGFMLVAAVAVVVLLVRAVVGARLDLALVANLAAGVWIVMLTLLAVRHPDVELEARASVSVVLAVALVLAVVGSALRQAPVRWTPAVGLEGVGAAVALLTLAVGAGLGDAAWLAAWCTAAGVTTTAVGLLVTDRRWARIPGAVLLGLAWVLRLAASDVTTVEAYTLPFAAVALAVGALALRRDPALRTLTALGGGLALALLPTTLVALADPVSLRAAVLGVVALALLAGGLALRWQAPFVAGGGVLLLLALVELAPYGWALPRWVLIGGAGLLLLIGGITWESRVRDGRAAVRFVRSMR